MSFWMATGLVLLFALFVSYRMNRPTPPAVVLPTFEELFSEDEESTDG